MVSEALGLFAAGAVSYWGYFHRGEHFLYGTRYLQLLGLTVLAGAIFLSQQANIAFSRALSQSSGLAAIFLLGVYSNCIIYRLFLNPLNKFPGPYWARLSKFDHVFRNVKFDGHHVLLRLHEKYGKIVRIGPNDLSVIDADATQVVSAPNSKCRKAPWYDQDKPLNSLHTTRDRTMHDRRRRIWAPAFSDKALRGYENRVQAINDLLMAKFEESKGKPVNAATLFNLYSFDIMGDLAFGESLNSLDSGELHWAIKLLNAGMDPLALQLPGWFFRLLAAIPGAAKGYWEFIDFCTKQLEKRISVHEQADPEKPDIAHTLIDHYQSQDKKLKKEIWPFLCGDSRLIIVAGSDTTAATLVHLFYHIAGKPEWQKKLREEIQGIKEKRMKSMTGTVMQDAWLKEEKDAPILNAMINETLRLNPPVPSGVFRETPKEGVKVGETFIPGNTVIQMPQYAMSRSEDNFEKATEFIPERWYSKPDMIKHKDAFQPFSSGPFGCIGKNLAYMEIRTITSQIVDQFNVALAPGEDGKRLLMKSTDHFTMGLEPLMLTFERQN